MSGLNIHVISVAYGVADELRAMWDVVQESEHCLHWHLFRHSTIPDVVTACAELAQRENVTYYPYGENRGLARSLNEGLLIAFDRGADLVVNIADDMLPDRGDFDRLVKFAMGYRHFPAVVAEAWHEREQVRGSCEISFTAFNPAFLATVGMFDENLFPAYYEDTDMIRRLELMGWWMPLVSTGVVHRGSANIRRHPELMAQNHVTFAKNRDYYVTKWGGDKGREQYEQPFGDPRFGLRIDPRCRKSPYQEHDRRDREIVVV